MKNFRTYSPHDEKAVIDLHALALKAAGNFANNSEWDADLRNIEDHYLNNQGCFIVVEFGRQIIAMGALKKIDSQTAEIKRMRVHPDYQRQGIGESVLSNLENKARNLGYKKLVLDTTDDLTAARTLYEKTGYKVFDHKIIEGFPFVFYEKSLL